MEVLDVQKVAEDNISLSSQSQGNAEALRVHFIIVALGGGRKEGKGGREAGREGGRERKRGREGEASKSSGQLRNST